MKYVKFNDLEDGGIYLVCRCTWGFKSHYKFVNFFKYDSTYHSIHDNIFYSYMKYYSSKLQDDKIKITFVEDNMIILKCDDYYFELNDEEILNHVVLGTI